MIRIESYIVLLYILLNDRSVIEFIITVYHSTVETDNKFNYLYIS